MTENQKNILTITLTLIFVMLICTLMDYLKETNIILLVGLFKFYFALTAGFLIGYFSNKLKRK